MSRMERPDRNPEETGMKAMFHLGHTEHISTSSKMFLRAAMKSVDIG